MIFEFNINPNNLFKFLGAFGSVNGTYDLFSKEKLAQK